METSKRSTLKVWTARPVMRGKRQLIGIICPHCEGRALVARSWADENPDGYKTRPCPYCFKASWLPGKHPDQQAT